MKQYLDLMRLVREAEAGGVPRHCGHPPFGMREFGRVLTGPAYARRLVAGAAAAGAALVFLGVSNELTATLLLSPLGTRTLSTGFWALTSEIDYVAAAPYAMLMILISLPLTAILYMQSKKIAGL